MIKPSVCVLLVLGLLVGLVTPAQAQRGRHRGRGYYVQPGPRRYYRRPAYRPSYGPRYYHAAPYRSYGGALLLSAPALLPPAWATHPNSALTLP
jgi:hypothetical protein